MPMPDHDPLASALVKVGPYPFAGEVRAALDAAGYEVRPKLTAERLAAAHTRIAHDSAHPDWDVLFDWHRDEWDEAKTLTAFAAVLKAAALDDAP
jgi:hypothetical protein